MNTLSASRLATFVSTLLVLGMLLPVLPAEAVESRSCPPARIVDAFNDVPSSSVHASDVNCLAYLGVVRPGGVFEPESLLSRWEMAIWMKVAADYLTLPPYVGEGFEYFTDTDGLPDVRANAHIESIRLLGITNGVGGTRYAPHGAVPRWQMALFLTRFLTAVGYDLPAGGDQGFVDLGSASGEARTAINQLAELGITVGTSATTFAPSENVTKQQMASFVARTLERAWVFRVGARWDYFASTCDRVVPAGLTYEVVWCLSSITAHPEEPLRIRDFIRTFTWLPGHATDMSPLSRKEIFINGESYVESETVVRLETGLVYKYYDVELSSPPETVVIQVDEYYGGTLRFVDVLTVKFES